MKPHDVALALADTFLAREARQVELEQAAHWALDRNWTWIPHVCRSLLRRTGEHFHSYSRDELAALILARSLFTNAWDGPRPHPEIRRYCLDRPLPTAAPAWLSALALPALPTLGDLAHWLDLPSGQLDWFADQWRANRAGTTQLQHYHYRWLPKRSGGLRLLEIPKQRLSAVQRRILVGLLNHVPPHAAVHGFRRRHSALSHAALHTGQRVVMRVDLKDFFSGIAASRVQALFARLGYPTTVAGALARICTHCTPPAVLREPALEAGQRQPLRSRHLPQGSPCSPALANLCAYRLDMRLDALARSMGANYSRYADDLTFSGGAKLERAAERFHVQVIAIAYDEGFTVNTRKTRIMRAATRQQVTGIVVNQHPNIARKEVDTLKAMLTNCLRHGPDSQNREGREHFRAYLAGRVAHVQMVNAARGLKLRALLDQIAWKAAS